MSTSSEGPHIYLLSLTQGDLPAFEVCTAANHTTLDYFLMVVLSGSRLKACILVWLVDLVSNWRCRFPCRSTDFVLQTAPFFAF